MVNETRLNIFWSWQSDTPAPEGRDFVKDCLRNAIREFAQESELNDADRPQLDHDTRGMPGLVPIADTIFAKIDAAALFVADVSFTGASPDGSKKTPNPNVLIELGYALKSLGAPRIVLVANSADGFRPEDLPFDLRHRRGPITYHLPAGADKTARAAVKKVLVKDLTAALRSNWASIPTAPAVEPERHAAMPGEPAVWFDPSESFKLYDEHVGHLAAGATKAYLRIAVAGWNTMKPTRRDLIDKGFHPFGQFSQGSSTVSNPLGVIASGWVRDMQKVTALTQWFDKTGEIWGVSPAYAFEKDRTIYLANGALAKKWLERLGEWVSLLDKLGARKPYRVEAGLTGALGLVWPGDWLDEPQQCMDDQIVHTHSDTDWSKPAQERFITEVFGKILDSFSLQRLSPPEVRALSVR